MARGNIEILPIQRRSGARQRNLRRSSGAPPDLARPPLRLAQICKFGPNIDQYMRAAAFTVRVRTYKTHNDNLLLC